jgi:hypothetical protein
MTEDEKLVKMLRMLASTPGKRQVLLLEMGRQWKKQALWGTPL